MKFRLLFLVFATLFTACKDNDDIETLAAFDLPESSAKGTTVSFQNKSKNATRYAWNFGDGSMEQEDNPSHVYNSTGVYSIKLKAFGTVKNDSITKTIMINPYDIFAHTDLHFAGTYACKVVRATTSYGGNITKVRLPDQDVSITKESASILSWNTTKLTYLPSNPNSPQLPDGSKYTFSFPYGPTSPRFEAYASFYTSGDSATFIAREIISPSSRNETTYYGIRRP